MRPLIGIPPCLDDRGRWRSGRDYHYIDATYARVIAEAGGSAVYLPQEGSAAIAVQHLDGLLVPGGDDLAPPSPYPESVCFDLVPDAQLHFDRELLAAALARRIPVLGICYGMQLLGQAFGGSLHYDLATDLPEAASHQLPEATGRHELHIEANSRLATLWKDARVNSLHHQALETPGRCRVVARAADDVIEAIEGPGPDFVLGVQWHPEKQAAQARAGLFEGFVRACAGPPVAPRG
jgi:putative glutamine amidotransferase